MIVKKEERIFDGKETSLKSEVFRKFLEKCVCKIDNLDKDLSLTLDQMEVDARERTINYYYQIIGKFLY
ncbi:MAG: hypothetical protein AB1611_18525 [bacterium]